MRTLFLSVAAACLLAGAAHAQEATGGSAAHVGASVTANPSNPTGTTSGSEVMMGMGSTCTITPSYSTKVFLAISGSLSVNTTNQTIEARLRYGTGAAPANGAAATGTALLNYATLGLPSVSGLGALIVPYYQGAVATGLTVGTPYWFDLGAFVTGATGTLTNLTCTAFEVP